MKSSWFAIITILSFVLVMALTFTLAKSFSASPVEIPDPETKVRIPSLMNTYSEFDNAAQFSVPVSSDGLTDGNANVAVEKPELAPTILPTSLAAAPAADLTGQNNIAAATMDIAHLAGIVERAVESARFAVSAAAAIAPAVSAPDVDVPAAELVVEASDEDAAASMAAAAPDLAVDTLAAETANGVTLEDFAASVANGDAGQVVGVFSSDLFALPVVQQPWNQANFVSTNDGEVTQFNMPKAHGVTGLLAHNYLSGQRFFDLSSGENISVVYGDGRIERYAVVISRSFQALSPSSPYSNFIDVADPTEQQISSAELFKQVYTTSGQLVMQTCIDAYGDPSWGRLFVIAEKVSQ